MTPLSDDLRKLLKKAIEDSRVEAEAGARKVLESLAVGRHEPHGAMSVEERALRRRLREHGRQLGDVHNPQQGTQNLDQLVHEIAYQHWHQILFARFLAENGLLIEPTQQIPISMEDCEELAHAAGENTYSLAAQFAQASLPQIFRSDSAVFELSLPREHQIALEKAVADLPAETFTGSDALGWVYQFWQTKRKAEVNASGVKIGAQELSPVTQLFTEPYMVSFLLDNALGSWWATRKISQADLESAQSEEELRSRVATPEIPLRYLRFVKTGDDCWAPAAGAFERWPADLREFKVLDPCCGSGHFLVAAFHMLVPMRMADEELTAREAVDAVLRDNLHGLELDERCVELAAFALAVAAWTYPGAGGYRPLPELHLACSGANIGIPKKAWKQLAGSDPNLALAMDGMYDLFKDAPTLGSLIEPRQMEAAKAVPWPTLSNAIQQALDQGQPANLQEAAVVAKGLAKAASLLAGQYHWIITNVPYLARGKQDNLLREFCQDHYTAAKGDLATVFLERCIRLCVDGGTSSIVLPQNWLFLTSYKKFRELLLKRDSWHLFARLGEGAFESPAAAGAFVAMLTISKGQIGGQLHGILGDEDPELLIRGMDVSEHRKPEEKAASLVTGEILSVSQGELLRNPDARVTLELASKTKLFSAFASSHEGLTTGDLDQFVLKHWEQPRSSTWHFYIQNSSSTSHYSGRTDVIRWGAEGEHVHEFPGSYVKGKSAWSKIGLRITQMRKLPITMYAGEIFGKNAATIVPNDNEHLPAIWCYCASPDYHDAVRRIDQKINVTIATLVKVPFDLEHWTRVADEQYPNGLPEAYSDDPTQWVFHGHPCGSVVWDEHRKRTAIGPLCTDRSVLQTATARLLGYRWPAELDPAMELAAEQKHWIKQCENLLPFADEDGIVCLSAIRNERSAADRLREILAAAYGGDWSHTKERDLLAEASDGRRLIPDFETWLRDHFFAQHCKLFNNRPFIWHIWDGLRDGFHCLVNAHRLTGPDGEGRRTLDLVVYSYLGAWIQRQKAELQEGKEGAEARLAHAVGLESQLEKILEGEPPYDIFARWKPLHEQSIGWDPDINDGVRLNIRPFMRAELRSGGRQGAGILRQKPNIKWGKDRGNDPVSMRPKEDFPWFWECEGEGSQDFAGGGKFDGNRWNDLHYSIAMKQAARQRHDKGK